jgi:hypothetical protein
MESPENDNAVFRPSHKPWKSIKPIPTFPPPPRPRAKYEIIPKRSRPRCPPQTRRSGSFLDWKRLQPLRAMFCIRLWNNAFIRPVNDDHADNLELRQYCREG